MILNNSDDTDLPPLDAQPGDGALDQLADVALGVTEDAADLLLLLVVVSKALLSNRALLAVDLGRMLTRFEAE